MISYIYFVGAPNPAIIPTGNALRILKSRKQAQNKRHTDKLTALAIMRTEEDFKNILQDMGSHPFFIHYHCSEQIHIYRSYCRSVQYPRLIIDATGSVVKNFSKFGFQKTRFLFLYEGVVYDNIKKHSFTVTNMISERHNNISIFNWLAKWINCDIPTPKETVCDQSLALLSAIVQCFTQYSSLKDYLRVCADIVFKRLPSNSHWLPNCFVRTDVAHFIKLVSKWTPLKTAPRRVREIIIRVIGIILKSQSLASIESIIMSLLIVITNETDGNDLISFEDTPCEQHKKILIQAVSTELNLEEIFALEETDDDQNINMDHEYECQSEELENLDNPFQSWSEGLFEKSKTFIREGNGINAMFLPALVPFILKCTKLLPLWSGLMVPFFGYGESTTSSAAVESSFKKLKHVIFKHTSLPVDIEEFLENHIMSLQGASLIRSAVNTQTTEILPILAENVTISPQITENVDNVSAYISNDCFQTQSKTCLGEEDIACENWNRKSKKQTNKSYLTPNPLLRHLGINNPRNIRLLPILKNGSRAEELKSCSISEVGKVILSNTCAFDTLASIFMAAYCDSDNYQKQIDAIKENDEYFQFISIIVTKGITASTYSDRAKFIVNMLNPELKQLEYNTTLAICDATAGSVLKAILKQTPTITEINLCSNSECKRSLSQVITYITYQTTDENINDLQQFLDNRLCVESSVCGYDECIGIKSIDPIISNMHIIIEILYWNSKLTV